MQLVLLKWYKEYKKCFKSVYLKNCQNIMQRIFILNPKNTAATINIKQSSVGALLTKFFNLPEKIVKFWQNLKKSFSCFVHLLNECFFSNFVNLIHSVSIKETKQIIKTSSSFSILFLAGFCILVLSAPDRRTQLTAYSWDRRTLF